MTTGRLSLLLSLILASFATAEPEPTAQDPERRGDQDPELVLTRLLRRFDADRDRRISSEEFPGPANRFRRLDRNGDGYLDRNDLPREEAPAPGEPSGDVAAEVDAEEAERFFEERIRPVLVESCYRCHSTQGDRIRGGLVLDARETLLAGGDSGPSVFPGDPDASLLVQAIRWTDPLLEMPPKERLDAAVVRDFEAWVRMGAPWPGVESSPAPLPAVTEAELEAGREWWAFQLPERAELPAVDDEGWAWTEIDRFLLAAMEERALEPVADAGDREWLRRVSLDLVGLPPTPEELEAFERDASPARYEEAVDRLLASPRFGERWGRHWLDVARYAESSGRETNVVYPHAWRYRDWVIEAFDRDLPYDRLLVEQIAGDLLPAEDATERARLDVATGFLAIGSKSHSTRDPRQFQADLADEQVDALTQGALGVTLACARCHDHKFDPFSQADYYAMAGILRSSETLYGTLGQIRNRHPAGLVELPAEAELPDGPRMDPSVLRFTRGQRERITGELEDLPEPEGDGRRRRGRGTMDEDAEGASDEMRASRVRRRILTTGLEIVEEVLSRFDDEGRPTEANRVAMGMREGRPADAPLLVRGDVESPGPLVPRGVPQVLSVEGVDIPEGASGRLELAHWVASPENPLTARVWVNRVWLHLFGSGIVTTPNNFGRSGQPPSHPELLDWLAATFVEEDGWSTKALVKRLVLSHTYRLSSAPSPRNERVDPEAVYLWHMPDRRLDAEVIRDSMLYAAGTLELERPVGSIVNSLEGQPRRERYLEFLLRPSKSRSVFLPVLRDRVPEALEVFDVADPAFVAGDRQETSVATQALFLMNDEEVLAAADALAGRVLAEEAEERRRIDRAFELVLGRAPSSAESRAVRSFLEDYAQLPVPDAEPERRREPRGRGPRGRQRRGEPEARTTGEREAWSAFVQTLFLCPEFRYAG